MAIKLHDSMFIHPGVWMRAELIDAHDLTVVDAAARLGVTRQSLSPVLNGHNSVTPEMAIRVQKVFGLDPETLLRMQAAYDLAQVRARVGEIRVGEPIAA
ncbi:HigA family addiction module antitoxin [Sphingomonas sp. 2378]|uniref:HigA family addiction module antitoxin n=1 Tax=Sphingomonas sp. 2378 TaxID=1219748 RepID=UPI00311AC156